MHRATYKLIMNIALINGGISVDVNYWLTLVLYSFVQLFKSSLFKTI